jgi:hypothetical protein
MEYLIIRETSLHSFPRVDPRNEAPTPQFVDPLFRLLIKIYTLWQNLSIDSNDPQFWHLTPDSLSLILER